MSVDSTKLDRRSFCRSPRLRIAGATKCNNHSDSNTLSEKMYHDKLATKHSTEKHLFCNIQHPSIILKQKISLRLRRIYKIVFNDIDFLTEFHANIADEQTHYSMY